MLGFSYALYSFYRGTVYNKKYILQSYIYKDDNPRLSPKLPRKEVRSKSHNQNEHFILRNESRKLNKQ